MFDLEDCLQIESLWNSLPQGTEDLLINHKQDFLINAGRRVGEASGKSSGNGDWEESVETGPSAQLIHVNQVTDLH